jgi:hypothetical protein
MFPPGVTLRRNLHYLHHKDQTVKIQSLVKWKTSPPYGGFTISTVCMPSRIRASTLFTCRDLKIPGVPGLQTTRSIVAFLLGEMIDMYSGLWEFSTQRKLPHLFPLECPVSRLHDLSPRGKILEEDTWPNHAGDMCHILTDISILHRFKTH